MQDFTYTQLQVIAEVARTKNLEGWSFEGSIRIAKTLNLSSIFVRETIAELVGKEYLEQEKVLKNPITIPVKITMKGHEARVRAFKKLFPDIFPMVR